jgi:hypothetical protein
MRFIMQTGTARPAVDVRALIVDTLRQHAYRPAELLEEVQSQGIGEIRFKEVLATLIDEGIVALSPSRQVTLRETGPALNV